VITYLNWTWYTEGNGARGGVVGRGTVLKASSFPDGAIGIFH
jgi:hypothetical protein